MRVRTYLILLISVVALGAFALVGGLNIAFQDLELERERQIQSSTAVDHLAYVKEDLGRLTTIGDLIFGASKGLNSYLAQPAISQLKQINDKLEEINQHIDVVWVGCHLFLHSITKHCTEAEDFEYHETK